MDVKIHTYADNNHKIILLESISDGHLKPIDDAVGGALKRVIDVIVASIIIIIAAPLFGLTAALIKFTDPGPLMYRHMRVGYGGQLFPCLKFRTMVVDSESILKSLLNESPDARAEWNRSHKLTNDPRITPLGTFLRRTSLDELPQFINVIRGEMSLVGPRPIVQAEMPRYGNKIGLYLSARPGITGAWQVSGRSNCSYEERVALDAGYVRNWRLTTDVSIMLKTFSAVLKQNGSC